MSRSAASSGIDEDALREGFVQQVVVGMGGVHAGKGVVADGL